MDGFDVAALTVRTAGAFAVNRGVRFQDVDAAGILFHPRLLEYFHDAYLELMAAAGTPLEVVLRTQTWGSPLRRVEAHYLKPLRFGDRIEIAMVGAKLQLSDVAVGYRVARLDNAELVAVGQTHHVFVDLATFRRVPIPEPLRNAFQALGS
jgi:YbgC/YbaW family acyl-CoA thioester hydrolase